MLRATSLPYFTNTPSCLFVAKATHRFPLTREIGSSDLTLLHLFPFHITKGVLFLIHIIYLRSFLIDHPLIDENQSTASTVGTGTKK